WIGQLTSLVNRDFAIRVGIWEADMPPEYEVYENAIAVADVAIGWVYGIAGAGLILGVQWGYTLAWIPGVILLYHSISFLSWTGNQKKAGRYLTFTKNPARAGWFLANFITGALAITVALSVC
ncbi:MAG: hypothetical protein MUF37_05780, partial [Methanoregulaceae archaeon]|nr:hypothetical protein [Methanoregulaceae archaeon]